MMPHDNCQIFLVERPLGALQAHHFKRVESVVPDLAAGQILVRTILISIDAANRGWMQGRVQYRAPVSAGQLMSGNGLGEVIDSTVVDFAPGDLVFGDLGWQQYAVTAASAVKKTPAEAPLSHGLSVFGVAGRTAYVGLLNVAGAKAGETVLVSAAGGAVGSFVGQIAKLIGCRTIGIAGGELKCARVKTEFDYDQVIDHRSPTFFRELREVCPEGIDVYFDNTGGKPLEAALALMKIRGRIACCGAVSQYDIAEPTGPRGVPGLLVVKRLRMEGFLVHDFASEEHVVETDLRRWVADGQIKVREEIVEGLTNAPDALIGLLSGRNIGKCIVRVAPDSISNA